MYSIVYIIVYFIDYCIYYFNRKRRTVRLSGLSVVQVMRSDSAMKN